MHCSRKKYPQTLEPGELTHRNGADQFLASESLSVMKGANFYKIKTLSPNILKPLKCHGQPPLGLPGPDVPRAALRHSSRAHMSRPFGQAS